MGVLLGHKVGIGMRTMLAVIQTFDLFLFSNPQADCTLDHGEEDKGTTFTIRF